MVKAKSLKLQLQIMVIEYRSKVTYLIGDMKVKF